MGGLIDLLARYPRYGIGAAAVPHRLDLPTYIRITDIDKYGRFSPDPAVSVDSPLSEAYRLARGELVVARTGASVGKSYLYDGTDGPLVFAGFLIAVTPDPTKLDPAFLSHYMQSKPYWDWVKWASTRSGQPGINARQLAAMTVEFPSLEEQRAIACRLRDAEQESVAIERLIIKRRAIKQGMMQELLTGRKRLPGFTSEWHTRSVGEIAAVTMGQSPSGRTYNTSGVGTPLIQGNADIRNRRTFDRVWTSEPKKRVGAGEVVLTVRAPVGYTGITSTAACLGRGVCGVSAGESTRFLFHALILAEPRWALLEQGSTFTSVNSATVRAFEIDWPEDAAERSAIARVLDDADAEIAALDRRLEATRAVKQGMMQELLTGSARLVLKGVSA